MFVRRRREAADSAGRTASSYLLAGEGFTSQRQHFQDSFFAGSKFLMRFQTID